MTKKSNRELRDEFRKIPSLDFLYEVNENGTVIRNVKSKKHLKCFIKSHNSNTKYWCTQVNIKHNVRKVFLHRVVAECWLGPRPAGMEVDHIDRNSRNNHYTNLRYVTKSEQMLNRDYAAFEDRIWSNLAVRNGGVRIPVELRRGDETLLFPSTRKAAKYLVTVYPDKNEKSFTDKFHLRRKRIFDYDIRYLNAETGHGNLKGKEQSTKSSVSSRNYGEMERREESRGA